MSARIDYDPITGAARFLGWAVPLVASPPSDGAAVWRIARPHYVSGVYVGADWADGDDTYDNVWANRNSLSYLSGDFTLEPTVDLDPTGARPGNSFTSPVILTPSNHTLWLSGMKLHPLLVGIPSLNEYAYSGTAITVGGPPIRAGAHFLLRVQV